MNFLCLIGLALSVQGQNHGYHKRSVWSRLCNVQSCTKCLIAIDGFPMGDIPAYQRRCYALLTLDGCCPMGKLLTKF